MSARRPNMGTYYIEQAIDTTAQAAKIWALLADLTTYPTWGVWDAVSVESGDPHAQSSGMVRSMRAGRVAVRERIISVVPARLLQYELLSGLPVRRYLATVRIEPRVHGCHIVWCATFSTVLPGTGAILRRAFGGMFGDLLRRLTAAAEIAALEPAVHLRK